MKRKFLAVILPLIGCATVVGSGFSAWYFGSTVIGTVADNQLGLDITNKVEGTTNLEVSCAVSSDDESVSGMKLILDQDGKAQYDNENAGIFVTSSNDLNTSKSKVVDMKLKYTFTYNPLNAKTEETEATSYTTLDDLDKSNIGIRFVLNINIWEPLAAYIDVNTTDNTITLGDATGPFAKFDGSGEDYTYTYTVPTSDMSSTSEGTTTWSLTIDLSTKLDSTSSYHENTLFSYDQDQKPTTSDLYDSMVGKLNLESLPEGSAPLTISGKAETFDRTTGNTL